MEEPFCPFCEQAMVRSQSAMEAYYHSYVCNRCHAQLRQMLVRPPEEITPAPAPLTECCLCQSSDLYCFDCGDPVCGKHIRTVEKYADYLSPELAVQMLADHGGQIYCPLCFQATIRRFSLLLRERPVREKSSFNLPVILFLLSLVVIIMIGVQRCDNTDLLRKGVQSEAGHSTP